MRGLQLVDLAIITGCKTFLLILLVGFNGRVIISVGLSERGASVRFCPRDRFSRSSWRFMRESGNGLAKISLQRRCQTRFGILIVIYCLLHFHWFRATTNWHVLNSAKFQKPTLKRVKMSVTQMLTSILGNKTAQVDMRSNLKNHAPINEW